CPKSTASSGKCSTGCRRNIAITCCPPCRRSGAEAIGSLSVIETDRERMVSEVHPVPTQWAENALIDEQAYQKKYRRSIEDPEGFWREEAARLNWIKSFSQVKDTSFNEADFRIRWFEDGTL